MKEEKYSRLGVGDKRSEILKLGGMDERLKIPKGSWEGWKIRDTLGQMGRMYDQEYSHWGKQ